METPNFIESYETGLFDLADAIKDRLDFYISAKDDESVGGHFMDGSVTNGSGSNRKDYSFDFFSLSDSLVADMHSVLREYIPKYADKHVGFGMQSCMSQAMKVQKTPPKGGFHTWHCEHSPDQNSSFRNLTWTFYLNDIPDGEGETEFLEYGLKLQPKKALLTLFPSGFTHTHRGNPVYSCDKYIATGWYYLV